MIGNAQTARPAYNVKIQLMRTKCCSVICVTEGMLTLLMVHYQNKIVKILSEYIDVPKVFITTF